MPLHGRTVVLGVCGSIAAYKAVDLASKLTQAGAKVDVVLTEAAQEFVSQLSFRAVSGRDVYTNMFDPAVAGAEVHVALGRRADLIVVAPATATTIARLAHGLADDMLSLTVLASRAPVLIAPAMDSQMWEAEATQANVRLLKERGTAFVGPERGRLASGLEGSGRMAEPETIAGAAKFELARNGDLAGRSVVVSAGGTREPIDPVRVIGNRSSGRMGYALAEAARDRGAAVTLVSTATLPLPYGVALKRVETVSEMREAVLEACGTADALIMAAAVSDFRPAETAEQKIKKGEGGLVLPLVKNADFLDEVPESVVKVGFAAETEHVVENAQRKLIEKRLDLNIANDVSATDAGFEVEDNRVTILDPEGGREDVPLMSKYEVAQRILDRLTAVLEKRRPR